MEYTDGKTLKAARQAGYRLTAAACAAACGVTERTWRRWEAARAPLYALRLAQLLGGELGALAPAWAGWRLVGGALVTPEDDHLTTGNIRAVPYWRELARDLIAWRDGPGQYLLPL